MLINDIASQINLLTLNATIEAPRAGDIHIVDINAHRAVIAGPTEQQTAATQEIVPGTPARPLMGPRRWRGTSPSSPTPSSELRELVNWPGSHRPSLS